MNLESTAHSPPKRERDPWIRNPKRFRLAMILTGILTLLSITYPGVRPLYEELLLAIGLPLSVSLGGNDRMLYGGLIFSGFALWALYLIWDSLIRHRIIFCVMLLVLLPMLSNAALAGYQALIPRGVYAVSVDQKQQACQVTLENGTASGNCTFVVTNRGGQPLDLKSAVTFEMEIAREKHTLEIPLEDAHIGKRSIEVIGASFSKTFPELAHISGNMSWSNPLGTGAFKLSMSDGKRERVWGD